MHEHEDHNLPDVSTEPQRQALDEMSRQLMERLNIMVEEQHERARAFAATQHSLSHLPGQTNSSPELPPPPAPLPTNVPGFSLPQVPASPAPRAKRKKNPPVLPPHPARPKVPQEFDTPAPAEEAGRADWLRKLPGAAKAAAKKEGEESGCGTFPTIVAIAIIVILLRACS